ncbi:hypothetical protein RFW90_17375, partial [Acinetobacter baumannii]|nr:hypothetical protein [Acinetobacter baumannii]
LMNTKAPLNPDQQPEALRENIDYVRGTYINVLRKVITSGAPQDQIDRALEALGADSGMNEADLERMVSPPDDSGWVEYEGGVRVRSKN